MSFEAATASCVGVKMKLNLKEHYFSVSKCGMFKFCTTVCKCGMLHKSLKCVIFQALAGLLVIIITTDDSEIKTQPIIVRFGTFRHRTLFYRSRKILKNKSVQLDLTKKRYSILKEARKKVEGNDRVKFVFADINCRLKVKFSDNTEKFFQDIQELDNILCG